MASCYETLRERHVEQFQRLLPAYIERTTWPAERLQAERQWQLRELLGVAKERSPWHRERLSHLDPDGATEADLRSIPPMTKDDLMSDFDAILTDPRLSRDTIEAHLASLSEDAYLLDEFHVVASGGSSGTRGVFVYGWHEWLVCFLTMMRFRLRYQLSTSGVGLNASRATIAAAHATHMTYAMASTFRNVGNVTPVPATLPLPEIVDRLNVLQPAIVTGYPSMLYALAGEAAAARLAIEPRMVGPNSEPLLPEMRRAMEEAWHCPLLNVYGTSEGVSAASCGQGLGMHLSEDVAIFERVDQNGNPVPAGVRPAKMYVTNLYNRVQPLIRYELTDEVSMIDDPCPCGCAMARSDDIEGRSDDVFTYDRGVVLHPLVFRSRLGAERNIVEYQVRQTRVGADVFIRAVNAVDINSLALALERDMAASGVPMAKVSIQIVVAFDRPQTGKLRRFVPLDL